MFTLIIEDKDGSIADEYSFDEGEFIIGRSHSSDIILPADNVSRRHARLYTQGGTCFVEDLGSSNGVHVNGARIHGVCSLGRSSQIKIGDYFLHVEGGGSGQVTGRQVPPAELIVDSSHTAIASLGIADHELSRPGSFGRLVGTNLATQGRPFEIMSAVNLIGRGKDCSITILDPSVSRIHAKILVSDDGSFSVEDLRSSNGVYVNTERVDSSEFGHGDRVRFGNVEFICERIGPVIETSDAMIQAFKSPRRKAWLIGGIIGSVLVAAGIVGAVIWSVQSNNRNKKVDRNNDPVETSSEISVEQRDLMAAVEAELNKAKAAASKGKWSKARKSIKRARQRRKKNRSVDKKRTVDRHIRKVERALIAERKLLTGMTDAIEGSQYKKARRKYDRLLEKDGVMKKLATKKLMAEKTAIQKRAEALCSKQDFTGCLKEYRNARALDKDDKVIGRRIYELRNQMATTGGNDGPAGTD